MRFPWERASLIAFAMVTCCEGGAPQPDAPRESPPPSGAQVALETRLRRAREELDREFVVFSVPTLAIDRLGVPVPPPVTVGSRPGPGTLLSDAPDVVRIDWDGSLIAVREGAAHVRAVGTGSSLAVTVRPRRTVADSQRAGRDVMEGGLR